MLAPLQRRHLKQILDGGPCPGPCWEPCRGLYPELQSLTERLLESAQVLQEAADVFCQPATGPRDLLRWCARLRRARLVLSPVFTEESRTLLLREALQVPV